MICFHPVRHFGGQKFRTTAFFMVIQIWILVCWKRVVVQDTDRAIHRIVSEFSNKISGNNSRQARNIEMQFEITVV